MEVGIAEGIYHLTSMLCEIPSGMAADLFGRKKTLYLAGIAGVISSVFMAIGDWLGFVYIGMIFSAVGLSMVSGTEEAMLYDSLTQVSEVGGYKKIKANLSVVSRISSTASCLFSPISIFMGYQKVYLFSALMNVIQILLVVKMKEPVVTEKQMERQEAPFAEIGKRTKQHVIETFLFMIKNPKTMCKLLADAAIACPCYLTLMYLQEHLVECGWSEAWIGLPILVIPMAGAIGAFMAAKVEINLFKATIICGVISGIGTAFAGNTILLVSIIGAVLGRICEGFFEILSGERINEELDSDQRATMISVDSMLYSVLMIVISPVTGYLAEVVGMKNMFQVFGGCLILATVLATFLYRQIRKNRKHCHR